VLLTSATGFSQGEWEQWFRDPPPGYRPEVYWDWMGGLISREGITKDLEALEHAGVGGVLIMQMPDQLQWMIEPYFLLNHDWRTAAARAHLAGSEFWMGGPQLIGPAPDSAALYDQKVVWAEAFTSESWESAWRNDPWRMKPFGDAAFCRGINHLVMHGFTHNPWDDRFQPGVTMGLWSTQIEELWGQPGHPGEEKRQGRIIADQPIASALDRLVEGPDFVCQPLYIPLFAQEPVITPRLLYRHRRSGQTDIYFLSNQEDRPLEIRADFRVAGKQPELWDPGDGAARLLRDFHPQGKRTLIPLRLEPRQSFFVVFRLPTAASPRAERPNIPVLRQEFQLTGAWEVGFDPKRGGPERVTFDALADWTQRAEPGIQYYSGAATYQKEFDLPPNGGAGSRLFLDLGTVRNLAQVQLNGQDLGVVWCAPWRVQISGGVKPLGNRLATTVINTWANRLIGDEVEPEDCELVPWNPPERKGGYAMDVPGRGLRDLPDWLLTGAARPSSHRYTFNTWRYYPKGAPLLPSGLLGPVTILGEGESAEHK